VNVIGVYEVVGAKELNLFRGRSEKDITYTRRENKLNQFLGKRGKCSWRSERGRLQGGAREKRSNVSRLKGIL